MFAVAFLQELGNGRLRIEERMLKSEFERRGTPVDGHANAEWIDRPDAPQARAESHAPERS